MYVCVCVCMYVLRTHSSTLWTSQCACQHWLLLCSSQPTLNRSVTLFCSKLYVSWMFVRKFWSWHRQDLWSLTVQPQSGEHETIFEPHLAILNAPRHRWHCKQCPPQHFDSALWPHSSCTCSVRPPQPRDQPTVCAMKTARFLARSNFTFKWTSSFAAQAVSRRLLTTKVHVRVYVGCVMDKVSLGQVLLRVLQFATVKSHCARRTHAPLNTAMLLFRTEKNFHRNLVITTLEVKSRVFILSGKFDFLQKSFKINSDPSEMQGQKIRPVTLFCCNGFHATSPK